MHTLSLEENIETLKNYCQRKGGKLWNSITVQLLTFSKYNLASQSLRCCLYLTPFWETEQS
jgi:hypothetical protein